MASRTGRTDIVKLLVERGPDVNARDHLGRTALYEAGYYRHTKVERYLEALPTPQLKFSTRADVEATEVQITNTNVDLLTVRSGSYHASVRSVLSIQRLCINGGRMVLDVYGDSSKLRISELVVNIGGSFYMEVSGKRPNFCIDNLMGRASGAVSFG